MIPSSHLILYCPLLLLPSIFPSNRVFSNESALCIRWPKYWSFSFIISPSNEYSEFISLGLTCLIYLLSIGERKKVRKFFSYFFFFPVHRRWECKSVKSRNTWNSRQIWPWSTKRSRQRLTELCQENALVIANTVFQQHKRQLHTWHHQMVNTKITVIIIFAAEDGETLGSKQKKKKKDLELTVAQIMSSLLKKSDLNWRK